MNRTHGNTDPKDTDMNENDATALLVIFFFCAAGIAFILLVAVLAAAPNPGDPVQPTPTVSSTSAH